MVRNGSSKGHGGGVGSAAAGSRPASRARRTASGGIRTPEVAYETLLDCASDILSGAITPLDSNGVRNAITGAVVVAKHADMMAEMSARCRRAAPAEAGYTADDDCPDDGLLDDDPRDERIRQLEREVAALKRPKKG